MKLLFDQNLSYKLVASLIDVFPESAHVRDLGLGAASTNVVSFSLNNTSQHLGMLLSRPGMPRDEGAILTKLERSFWKRC